MGWGEGGLRWGRGTETQVVRAPPQVLGREAWGEGTESRCKATKVGNT